MNKNIKISFPIIENKEIKNNEYNEIISPINGKIFSKVTLLKKNQITSNYDFAQKAFLSWKNTKKIERIKYLNKWKINIQENIEEIAESMYYEIGKNYKSSISEIKRSIQCIEKTIEAYYSLTSEGYDGDYDNKNKIAIFKRRPLGIILCISPFNYPINLAVSKIAPALITGNVVIFKCATQASYSSYLLSKALIDTNIPSGVFSFVTGKGSEIGDSLLSNKKIKLINFTGSTNVGKNIVKKGYFSKYILELGGNGCAIVLNDCNIKNTAQSIIKGAFSYNGQRCTAIKRVIVEKSIYSKLIDHLKDELNKYKVGFDKECDITPVIDKNQFNYVSGLINDAKINNCKIIMGNKYNKQLVYPTLIKVKNENTRIFSEEQFGPVLPILSVDDNNWKDIIKIINNGEYGLQSSVFTKDINKAIFFYENVDTGSMNINGLPERGPDYFPFLGSKFSGMNVQGIFKTIYACTKLNGLVINY